MENKDIRAALDRHWAALPTADTRGLHPLYKSGVANNFDEEMDEFNLLFVRFRGEADIQSGFMSTRPSKQVCVSSRALHAKYGEQASACLAGRPLDPTRDDSTRIGRGAVGVQVAAAHARGL